MNLKEDLNINISQEIKTVCPNFKGAAIFAHVKNTDYNPELWHKIDGFTQYLRAKETTSSIKDNSGIAATRTAYKACGKDPSRYRPSNEALQRRLVRGLALYQINTLVDLVNLVSLESGYSIGGFDFDKIDGNELTLGIGEKDEPYEGIGRGVLNIEGMPVYRDQQGGIGTPTSDHERTKISMDTKNILTLINGYDGNLSQLEKAADQMKHLIQTYADGEQIEIIYY